MSKLLRLVTWPYHLWMFFSCPHPLRDEDGKCYVCHCDRRNSWWRNALDVRFSYGKRRRKDYGTEWYE